MNELVLAIIFFLVMLPGIAGVILPVVPGIPYMFAIAVVYGLITHFARLSGADLAWLGALAVVSLALDYSSGLLGAKLGGASKRSLGYGALGLILGTIILPPIGGFAGLFLAVMLSELVNHQSQEKAMKAATGSLLGSLSGVVLNLLVAILFMILFWVFVLI